MSNFITFHYLFDLPWSNLNRDDTGTPKRLYQGGVLRGQLSSQSIKRGIRKLYENSTGDLSFRSGNLPEDAVDRAKKLNSELDPKEALKRATKAILALTKGEKSTGDSRPSVWLSQEELETLAAAIAVGDSPEPKEYVGAGQTGSLGIASMGRMFANSPGQNVEAAIAVSPAVSTHQAIIETDYFSTVDDLPSESQGAGSSFLGLSMYTNGVFYRSTTIDKAQLRRSWTGFSRDDADITRTQLAAMIEGMLYGLPSGKKNSTAPYTLPAVILVEEQEHHVAYSFETPVSPDPETGGYMKPSVASLAEQFRAARDFDPDNFRPNTIVSGIDPNLGAFGVEVSTKKELIDKVIDWFFE